MPVVNRPYNNFFETGVLYPETTASEQYGPFQETPPETGEWSFEAVGAALTKSATNASRLFASSTTPISQGTEPAWYNIPARIANTTSSINDAFQSTLIKVIVLVSIVGVVAVFGMSFLQAKATNLAK